MSPTSPEPPVPPGAELRCDGFVELVTDYLEGALAPADRELVEAHVGMCDGCSTVLAQWREVVRQAGRLAGHDVDAVDPTTRDRLLATFRRLHPG
jgi:anti-sigma factor RsiW